jgi:sigma-B regulation protein RsbU (phosphoserine phosphatase)
LYYANAGHPPPYRFRDGQLQALLRTGIPLGILQEETWGQETARTKEDDLLLLYTDGVTEAQNERGDFFDAQRLANVLRRHAGRPAPEIREALLQALARFTGDIAQADDITLLVLAREAAPTLAATQRIESTDRTPVINGGY